MMPISSVIILLAAYSINAQDILTVLGQQGGVTQFTDILSTYSDLVDFLNTGVHTRQSFSICSL